MSKRLAQLSREKEELIQQCAEQRLDVTAAFNEVRSSVSLSGALHGIGKLLRAHPMLTAGISSLLASGYAGALTRSGSSVLSLLRMARPVWSWWSTRRREPKNRPTS